MINNHNKNLRNILYSFAVGLLTFYGLYISGAFCGPDLASYPSGQIIRNNPFFCYLPITKFGIVLIGFGVGLLSYLLLNKEISLKSQTKANLNVFLIVAIAAVIVTFLLFGIKCNVTNEYYFNTKVNVPLRGLSGTEVCYKIWVFDWIGFKIK